MTKKLIKTNYLKFLLFRQLKVLNKFHKAVAEQTINVKSSNTALSENKVAQQSSLKRKSLQSTLIGKAVKRKKQVLFIYLLKECIFLTLFSLCKASSCGLFVNFLSCKIFTSSLSVCIFLSF